MRCPSVLHTGVAADREETGTNPPRSRSIFQIFVLSESVRDTASERASGESAGSKYAPGGPMGPSSRPVRSYQSRRVMPRPPVWYARRPVEDTDIAVARVDTASHQRSSTR